MGSTGEEDGSVCDQGRRAMKTAAPYAPLLPAHDPEPGMRRAQIARDRSAYRFVHAYQDDRGFDGVGLAASVPPADEFNARYIGHLLGVEGKILFSHTVASLTGGGGGAAASGPRPTLQDALGLTRIVGNRDVIMHHPRQAANRIAESFPSDRIAESFPSDLTPYNALFGLLGKPDIVARVGSTEHVQDLAFAWQRLAGANPMALQGIRSIPSAAEAAHQRRDLDEAFGLHRDLEWELLSGKTDAFDPGRADRLPGWFGVTDDHFQSVMGSHDSLARAAAEGRLYLADGKDVAGLPTATWASGELGFERPKWIYPTLSLYAWKPGDDVRPGQFVPVAIQCEQAGQNRHVWTPDDGVRWKMARTAVQCADGNTQELKYHLGRTHMVMEAAIVSCRRTMSPNHPVRILLEPHFDFTLPINDFASKNLIAPGGQVDQLFGSTLAGDLEILARGLRTLEFRHITPDRDAAARAVDDTAGLPDYPWRDDASLVYPAVHRWVTGYMDLYYESDDAVAEDCELQNFVALFSDGKGGAIQGVDPVQSREAAAWFVGALVWTASSGHSALNYSQFPMLGYVPNVPGALYAAAPTIDTPNEQMSWMMMLPPVAQAMAQLQIVYELSGIQVSTLGKYPRGWFIDDRVFPLQKRFRRELASIDKHIQIRNETRFMPYPYLRPSKTGQSVFI